MRLLPGALVLPVVDCGRQNWGQSEGIVAGAGPSRYVAAMQHEGDMGNAEYKPQITLGNLIQIASMLVLVTIAFQALNGKATANAESISKTTLELKAQDARLRALETATSRSDERLTNMIAILNKIDARLERIELSGPQTVRRQ